MFLFFIQKKLVRPLDKKMTKKLINIRLDIEVVKQLDTLCERDKISRPDFFVRLITEEYDFTDKLEVYLVRALKLGVKQKSHSALQSLNTKTSKQDL